MAIIANLSIKNAANADESYAPSEVRTGRLARWVRTLAQSLLSRVITMEKTTSPGNSGQSKFTHVIRIPFASSAPGADPALAAGSCMADIRITVPNMAPQATKDDLAAAIASYTASAAFKATLNASGEMPWG